MQVCHERCVRDDNTEFVALIHSNMMCLTLISPWIHGLCRLCLYIGHDTTRNGRKTKWVEHKSVKYQECTRYVV